MIRILAMALLLAALASETKAQSCPASPGPLPTTTPTPRPSAWLEQQAALRHRLQTGSYQFITFGDSIMAGWSEARLGQATGMTVLNAGFGQDGTEHTLWRLQSVDLRHQSPQYVLLLIGTNDIGYSSCDIVAGVVAVAKAVHSVFPSARIVVTSILPRGTDMLGADDKIRAVNKMLLSSASSVGFAFFDVHDAFNCGHKTPCPLFVPDVNLHLTGAGYDLLTSLLRTFMDDNRINR